MIIVANFLSMTLATFQCSLCKKKYPEKSYGAEKQKDYQTSKGCFDIRENIVVPYYPDSDGLRGNPRVNFSKCPALFYDGYAVNLIQFRAKYELGIMAYEGSFMDQPAKFVEIMELIHNLYKEEEDKIRKSQELKAKLRGR